jgi:hypothetical protein
MKLIQFETPKNKPVAVRADVIRYVNMDDQGRTTVFYDEPNGTTSWFCVNVSVEAVVRDVNKALEFSRM